MPGRKGRDMAGKDKEPQVRGRSGPGSQAASERKRAGARKKGAGRVPTVGKRKAGEEKTGEGGGLH
jgi:hypothetical protein